MRIQPKILWVFFLPISLLANPFFINFPIKEDLSIEDYREIQQKLQQIDIRPFVEDLYPNPLPRKFSLLPWRSSLATKEDFYNRISKALHQTLIDPEKGLFPSKQLIKIGQGGNRCIVSYATFNGLYIDLLKKLPQALEKTGFNGYVFLMMGGFPNPTGKEIQYCGVPYCFKIFTLLEAEKLGFHKVLWIDAAFVPLRDPSPLFEWIEKEGSFLKLHDPFTKYLLPKTRDYLKKLTNVDVLQSRYVSAQILGFDLENPKSKSFITKYYQMVELGFPFFSCFPEEYVFSSIIGQTPLEWKEQPFTKNLSFPELKLRGKNLFWLHNQGFFFLQKNH